MPRLILLLVTLLILAACGSTGAPSRDGAGPDDAISDDDPQPPGGSGDDVVLVIDTSGTAGGPGISVSDALAWTGEEPVLVNGALFVDGDGTVRLCEAIAESFPPQCGGARLVVEGVDLAAIPDLEDANGVRWAESVQLFGRVEPAG